ncbi:hypothetical protein WN51_12730 [Melipona quadrifasciata]|uniref:Uncharacterized protein n=1 Tax=Melipona quadrifasciata TaxID=166423 RepID=A0A0M9A0U3_9HYME|nr:hypothetical protein WN51_12730 [Melipona quadrifasciata]
MSAGSLKSPIEICQQFIMEYSTQEKIDIRDSRLCSILQQHNVDFMHILIKILIYKFCVHGDLLVLSSYHDRSSYEKNALKVEISTTFDSTRKKESQGSTFFVILGDHNSLENTNENSCKKTQRSKCNINRHKCHFRETCESDFSWANVSSTVHVINARGLRGYIVSLVPLCPEASLAVRRHLPRLWTPHISNNEKYKYNPNII